MRCCAYSPAVSTLCTKLVHILNFSLLCWNLVWLRTKKCCFFFNLPHPAEICCVHSPSRWGLQWVMHTLTHTRPPRPRRSHTHLHMLPPLTANIKNKRETLLRARWILRPDEDNESVSTLPTHRHQGYWLGGWPMGKPCVHVLHVPASTKKTTRRNIFAGL